MKGSKSPLDPYHLARVCRPTFTYHPRNPHLLTASNDQQTNPHGLLSRITGHNLDRRSLLFFSTFTFVRRTVRALLCRDQAHLIFVATRILFRAIDGGS